MPRRRVTFAGEEAVGFRGERSYAAYIMALRAFFMALSVGMIVLNAYFLYYTYQLDKPGSACLCSLGWRRSFIEASLLMFVVVGIVGLVVDWEDHFLWLSALYYGVIVAYLLVTRDFIRKMEHTQCGCAESRAFQLLNVVNVVGLFVLGVAIFALVALMLYFFFTS